MDQGAQQTDGEIGQMRTLLLCALGSALCSVSAAAETAVGYLCGPQAGRRAPPTSNAVQQDILAAKAGMMSANGVFDPRLQLSAGQNVSTTQQFFAGFGLFNTQVYGPSTTLGFRSTLPSGTSLSLDWTTSRTTSVFQLAEDSDLEQEISPYDTSLTLTITQNLLQGVLLRYNLSAVRRAKQNLSLAVA